MNSTENSDEKKTKNLSELTQGEMLGIFIIACIIIYFSYAVYSSTEETPLLFGVINLYTFKELFEYFLNMEKEEF